VEGDCGWECEEIVEVVMRRGMPEGGLSVRCPQTLSSVNTMTIFLIQH